MGLPLREGEGSARNVIDFRTTPYKETIETANSTTRNMACLGLPED